MLPPQSPNQRLAKTVRQNAPGVTASVRSSSPQRPQQPQSARSSDSIHAGTGEDSTAVGLRADSGALDSVALGLGAFIDPDAYSSVAIGTETIITATGQESTVLGDYAIATAGQALCLGRFTRGNHQRAAAIGEGCGTNADYRAVMKFDDVEIEPTSGSSATSLILRSPDGTRWRMGVSNAGVTTWTLA